MRIALVGTGVQAIPPVGYGGVERTIAEYADALRAAGHDPVVLNRVRHGRSLDEYLFSLSVPGMVRDARVDVVHASTPVVANRLALARIPFVYTTHSRHWFERAGARQRFGFWLERRAVRDARATVALTERLRDAIDRTVPGVASHVRVIPIGVDAERFRPDPSARTGRVALGVGVVRPMKRWELAAAAAIEAGWTFRLVGPTPDPEYAQRLRAIGPSVELLGEVMDDELRREYARSDVLLHPSRVEILAGAVLQGLSAGLPVLGAFPVAPLVDDGRTGWTAPSGASDAEIGRFLSLRLRELANDELRARFSAEARRVAGARFSWAAVVQAHLELYESVVGSRPAAG
ncbi:MAG: glycosyltransferase family 4 protein [Thermoplasmata archaeon]|nr:glycosyltransferase family 4 protein [Thermoplasmata archaeon]